MLTRTALTHVSTEGHGKATSVLHFGYYRKIQLHLISSSSSLVLPAALHSGQQSHAHTKSILKHHRTKNGFINNVFYLLKLKLMG